MPARDIHYYLDNGVMKFVGGDVPPSTSYTEIARWNDTSSDYRTAGDADYTNFGGVAWCANRNPLNNVADPFPLNTSTTYRLRYVQGGSATQASAEVIGTPTQAHIDSSPGGGIWCGRIGSATNMTNAFGQPESNPNSPARFNGGQWILEEQTTTTITSYKAKYMIGGVTQIPNWVAVANWQVGVGSSNTPFRADYYSQLTGADQYRGSLFANYRPFATTLTSPPNGTLTGTEVSTLTTGNPTYRLRIINNQGGTNGLPAGKSGVVVGTITILSNPFTGRFAFRVGTVADMREAFGDPPSGGAIGISAGGGNWILDRQDGTTTMQGDDSFVAVAETTLQTGDKVAQYDTDTGRFSYRNFTAPA